MNIYKKITKEHLFIFLVIFTSFVIFDYFGDFDYTGLAVRDNCYDKGHTCCFSGEGKGVNYFSLDDSCNGKECWDSCEINEAKNLITGDAGFVDNLLSWFKGLFKKEVIGSVRSNCCECPDGGGGDPISFTLPPDEVNSWDDCLSYCQNNNYMGSYTNNFVNLVFFTQNAQQGLTTYDYYTCISPGILLPQPPTGDECGENENFILSYEEGHASLGNDYLNFVCSEDIKIDPSQGTPLIYLSSSLSAHVEKADLTTQNYNIPVKASIIQQNSNLNPQIYYSSSCTDGDECLFSISDETSAHVAECGVFDINVCVFLTSSPECMDNEDCTDPSKPVCGIGLLDGICIGCVDDSECIRFGANYVCIGGGCIVGESGNIYDINGDGNIDILDAQQVINHLDADTSNSLNLKYDISGDGNIDISDVQQVINHLT